MKEISDEDYELFRHFQIQAERQKIQYSLDQMQNVLDDIDAPIRDCVLGLNFLGIETKFSCCGFDYVGQPYHKSHQHGEAYISFVYSDLAKQMFPLNRAWQGWRTQLYSNGDAFISFFVMSNPHWRHETCIHYSEELVIGIQKLQDNIWQYRDRMKEEITLYDTNRSYPTWWQYPTLKPAVICLSTVKE